MVECYQHLLKDFLLHVWVFTNIADSDACLDADFHMKSVYVKVSVEHIELWCSMSVYLQNIQT